MTYLEAKAWFEKARKCKDQEAAKKAWAAMEAAKDCPQGPKKAGYGSRAGKRQQALRRAGM